MNSLRKSEGHLKDLTMGMNQYTIGVSNVSLGPINRIH